MTSTIDKMPDHARLWIYQADRSFTPQEEEQIVKMTDEFVGQWAAHGAKLKAGYAIMHHRFIVISVDESFNLASGCSIDASVNLIRKIQDRFGLNLLDRSKVAYLEEGQVKLEHVSRLREAIAKGKINEQTEVFNNLVQNAGEWKTNWIMPAKGTWINRYFS